MKIYINNLFKVKKDKLEGANIKEDSTTKIKTDNKNYIRKGANKELKINNKNENKVKLKKDKFKINKYNLPKSYYALLLFMILLAGGSINILVNANKEKYEENYQVFSSNDEYIDVNFNRDYLVTQDENTNNIDTRNKYKEEVSSVSSNIANQINKVQDKVNNIVTKKEEPLVFAKPLKGEILKIYSIDKVIYSKTLQMWKTHDGIDIKANIGDIVYSVERGTVEKIYNDAFYGITIVINHGQGYKTSYSNLSEDTYIKVGESVKKSQKIGKIGETSIGEIKDESHLHFMLYENNNIVDPTSIFK